MKSYKITAILLLLCIIISCDKKDLERTNTHDPKSKNYKPSVPTLTTAIATLITSTSATTGGNVTADGGATVSARGVCWNTATNPTININKLTSGSGTGNYSTNLTGLTSNTKYYVRAYATNSTGTAYGNEITFITLAPVITIPTLTTSAISLITSTTATSGGSISSDGGSSVTARGVCWSTEVNPTIDLTTKTSDGINIGSYTSNLTDLTPSTLYYVRAYATNGEGTAYGNEISFTTDAMIADVPTLTTTDITLIASTTATSGGDITSDGGAPVTARGICWSTTTGPTTALATITNDGNDIGTFASNLTGLTASTLYYVRAYATNSVGTAYGNEISFTTSAAASVPVVSTSAVSDITTNSAKSGGDITNDGGAPVTDRGVCWSTSSNPDITLTTKTSDGNGTGSFISNLTDLAGGTTYYVRAYATNEAGTGYGTDVPFTTTAAVIPTITTSSVTDNIGISATSGGNISADGGSPVTARGVCWGPNFNPTISDSQTSDDTGSGTFISYLTGLTLGTGYHVRAYAINSAGTAYGQDIAFTTPTLPTIITAAITSITQTTAYGGGDVTLDGGATVIERGICWSINSNPTIDLTTKTNDGSGSGAFASYMTGLSASTTYYVRAYATNSAGTVYGEEVTFVTSDPVVPTLTTSDVSSVTLSEAEAGGNITDDGFALITARGVCWSTSVNPTVDLPTKTEDNNGTGTFTSSITALTPNTTYYLRSYATNSAGTGYGNELVFKTSHSTLTDVDGNTYYTVEIGTQIWMRENLKTTKYRDNNFIANVNDYTAWSQLTTGAYCWYNSDAATYKNTYGALYNWYTITDSRVLCPEGWHVPTDDEWTTLANTLGGTSDAGGKLKETGLRTWQNPNTGATNESGFTALPGGLRYDSGPFGSLSTISYFWSATETDASSAWYINLIYYGAYVSRANTSKVYGLSVRCVQD